MKRSVVRYGVGELYGFDLVSLRPEQIRRLASANNRRTSCPFKPRIAGRPQPMCSKIGGVCSLRQYTRDAKGMIHLADRPVVTCPHRFLEDHLVFEWVGETLLGTKRPTVISEVPFLLSDDEREDEAGAVGMIDKVLVNRAGSRLEWCALEMQAVYFSGGKMEYDFRLLRGWKGPGVPFPPVQRHPDFRSSGPKRLMPQLQIKVPTISRWGRKMAAVVDRAFWESLGTMREVRNVSNSEIVWFVVSYASAADGCFALKQHEIHFTTLSHAVEGLTGGTPVSLEAFEREILARIPHAPTS